MDKQIFLPINTKTHRHQNDLLYDDHLGKKLGVKSRLYIKNSLFKYNSTMEKSLAF